MIHGSQIYTSLYAMPVFQDLCYMQATVLWLKSKGRVIYKKEVRGLTLDNNVNDVLNFNAN